jgi:hypothetical protein
MATRRGGKSAGFVLTILLVFIYYFLSIIGVALARQGKLPPFAGVWLANLVFGIGGVVLLRQMDDRQYAAHLLFSARLQDGSKPVCPSSKPRQNRRGSSSRSGTMRGENSR